MTIEAGGFSAVDSAGEKKHLDPPGPGGLTACAEVIAVLANMLESALAGGPQTVPPRRNGEATPGGDDQPSGQGDGASTDESR
ncbi:hypothetical protein [Nonomuraea sp. JJY05]|jgi:hypothetical protein|uniref:hypothetical protein n=1 Tax=Nonomuraea sp. JJY05 TaxID=3350255 RepID=UPI00373E4F5F